MKMKKAVWDLFGDDLTIVRSSPTKIKVTYRTYKATVAEGDYKEAHVIADAIFKMAYESDPFGGNANELFRAVMGFSD